MPKAKMFNRSEEALTEIYSKVPSDEIRSTIAAWSQAYRVYDKCVELTLSRLQLTSNQWLMLATLFASSKPVNAMQLAKVLPIEAPMVTQLLNQLEKRDLIVRKRSQKDKRFVDLYLTERGYDLLKEAVPAISEIWQNAVGPLLTEDLKKLSNISTQIRNNMLQFVGLNSTRADWSLKFLATLMSQHNINSDFWQL
ncbi:MAG: MarR family transcriptional regulator [Dehalococcoidia bacterium]|nr:MarR family transcriptional regulator [Dehalococcoidia bacterium]